MPNFPGPYQLEYTLNGFTNPTRSHVIRVNCACVGTPNIGDDPSAITLQTAGGAGASLATSANLLWDFIRLSYNLGISCPGYTLWKFTPGSYVRTFISAGTLTNPLGTSGYNLTIAHQVTLTFRSAAGGILRLVLLETVNTGDQRSSLVASSTGTSIQKLAFYVLSADSVVLAADDGFPIKAERDSRGQNEAVWRQVYRS